jgi:hypothetical protein
MFGFGRRKAIDERAKSLGDLMVLLVGCIESMSLDDFIEANRRRGFVESYVEKKNWGRDYGFCVECEPEKVDFSFHVTYEKSGGRMLIAEGHRNYFGLVLTGISGHHQIGADIKETFSANGLRANEIGRDARALQAALLKFPGFQSTEQLYKKLGGL